MNKAWFNGKSIIHVRICALLKNRGSKTRHKLNEHKGE